MDDLSTLKKLHDELISLESQISLVVKKLLSFPSFSETDIYVIKHCDVCSGNSLTTIVCYLNDKIRFLEASEK